WADRLPRLEGSTNPFCLFVAAHLEALATRKDAAARQGAKVRLLARLLGRKLEMVDKQRLLKLIDWLLRLPERLDQEVWAELRRLNPEEAMTHITSFERIAMQKGTLIGRILTYEEQLKQPSTPYEDLAQLSVEELTQRVSELKQRLSSASNGTP